MIAGRLASSQMLQSFYEAICYMLASFCSKKISSSLLFSHGMLALYEVTECQQAVILVARCFICKLLFIKSQNASKQSFLHIKMFKNFIYFRPHHQVIL